MWLHPLFFVFVAWIERADFAGAPGLTECQLLVRAVLRACLWGAAIVTAFVAFSVDGVLSLFCITMEVVLTCINLVWAAIAGCFAVAELVVWRRFAASPVACAA